MHRALSFLRPSIGQLTQFRKLADNREKIKYGENYVQPRSRPRIFLARKFLEFVEGYERLMQKHTPTIFDVYNSLGSGTKLLYKDIQMYLTVSKELKNGKPVDKLSREQLEVFYKVPKDMIHVAPILIICAMPLTNYFIFPLLYAFPKQLLSSQFWTQRQLRYFELERHLKRVQYHDSILYHLDKSETSESELQQKKQQIVKKLRSGLHPTVEEILEIKPLFQDGHSLALHNIPYGHLRALSLSQGLRYGSFMPYGKLWRFGGFVWEIDRALVREGPLESLSDDDIARCCLTRGFNPLGASRTEAEEFLDKWLTASLQLKERELSLLLHMPIFLAYNHRNNFGVLLMPPNNEKRQLPSTKTLASGEVFSNGGNNEAVDSKTKHQSPKATSRLKKRAIL
ncbi:LETM1 domain-containing protein 1-like isoform X1 [Varroa jacobsoni]|uniref:LETM1 domain-containing protein 1-like isoform X1 n=1 Tax=Varroa jacobsoni TaxID=62625 RepID=UPI000BF97A68|nr:LETM1 domain-containing protein 1-like isoform X1 [Varroa jacobsoni]XP_022688684.1 LETM1 domain-containing protein 1-like isoform X1 [Varroa jacobsoni]